MNEENVDRLQNCANLLVPSQYCSSTRSGSVYAISLRYLALSPSLDEKIAELPLINVFLVAPKKDTELESLKGTIVAFNCLFSSAEGYCRSCRGPPTS